MISERNGNSAKKSFTLIWMAIMLAMVLPSGCGSGSSGSKEAQPASGDRTGTAKEPAKQAEESKIEKMETTISMGTHPAGATYHTVGSAVAKVVSTHTPVQMTVKPFSGPNAWMPLLNKGDIQVGIMSAPDAGWALAGTNGFQKSKNVRLLVRGNFITVPGYVVRKNSGIESVKDLKGKRVASDYAGNQIIHLLLEAELASVGLTWDDVKKVKVPDINAGVDGLRDNRLDAAFIGSPTTAISMEVHRAVGLKALNYADVPVSSINNFPEKVLKEIQSRIPGVEPVVTKEGVVEENTVLVKYPIVLVGSSTLSEGAAYRFTKALWENYKELQPIHPWLKSWQPEQLFDPNPSIPYHPGAVKFYKEQKIWNDKAEKRQQELLNQ